MNQRFRDPDSISMRRESRRQSTAIAFVAAAMTLCTSCALGFLSDLPATMPTKEPVSCELSCSVSGGAVKAKVMFKNTSGREIAILKRNLLLEPGRLTWPPFQITLNGSEVEYRGMMVKRAAPTAADYVSLKPGEVVHATVDISRDYELSRKGIYKVSYFSLNATPDGKSFFDIRSNSAEVAVQ